MMRKRITSRTPSGEPPNAKQLEALRNQLEALKELAGQAQEWAEEVASELDTAVYNDEQWSGGVQASLDDIYGQLEYLEGAIAERSSARDVVAFIRGKEGKESLLGLRKEIDSLNNSIARDRDERQQIDTHARQWVTLATEIDNRLSAVNEIVGGLAEVAVSNYYESARQRISCRYRNLWWGFWVLTFVVFSITIIPELGSLIRAETSLSGRGAIDTFTNFLATRVGTLTILGAALFTLRTSLRRTEKTEKEYETKALRLKTTIAAKDRGLSDNLLKGIAVAIQPDSDDEESDSS